MTCTEQTQQHAASEHPTTTTTMISMPAMTQSLRAVHRLAQRTATFDPTEIHLSSMPRAPLLPPWWVALTGVVLGLLVWDYSMLSAWMWIVWWYVRWVFLATGVFYLSAYLLSRAIGPDYLKWSSTLAHHCDVLLDRSHKNKSTESTGNGPDMKAPSLLDQIDSLQLSICSDDMAARGVLLTGATGFVGSLILRDLLLHRQSLNIRCIYVLCRSKRNSSAQERMEKHLAKPMYDFLSIAELQAAVCIVDADITTNNGDGGIHSLQQLGEVKENVTHVIHCAASVSFTQSLQGAAHTNIGSSLNMQELATKCSNGKAVFVHVSTAFVQGNQTGSACNPLPETLFSLSPYDPLEIYKSMKSTTDDSYAHEVMQHFGFPNTYTFSKCVCEHLLMQNYKNTIIIRPSIVSPAVENPFEGWSGDKPSTITMGAYFCMKTQWGIWIYGKQRVACIPVDVVSRFVLAKAFGRELGEPASKSIYHVTWNYSATLYDTFGSIYQLGSVLGHIGHMSAYIHLFMTVQLWTHTQLSLAQYTAIHNILVRRPFKMIMRMCEYWGMVHTSFKSMEQFMDIPLLFRPFISRSYHFASEINLPPCFDEPRYNLLTAAMASSFITGNKPSGKNMQRNVECFSIGGSDHLRKVSDLWWAMTQPQGGLMIRWMAWLAAKLFRLYYNNITIDMLSFSQISKTLKKQNGNARVIFVPNHLSCMDVILFSFLLFSLPELQINLPFMVATSASYYEKMPLIGWMFKVLRFTSAVSTKDAKRKEYATVQLNDASEYSDELNGTVIYIPVVISYKHVPERTAQYGVYLNSLIGWCKVSSYRTTPWK
jgi:alcohol-forming fatty acyl-CoA reductase